MDMAIEEQEKEAEKERERMWINYLSMIYSRPGSEGEPHQNKRAREEFTKALKPGQSKSEPAKVYDWDFERLKRIQDKQKGG